MAKKKGLAAYKKTKRAKKNNAIVKAKSNPPPMKDLLDFVIPGFVGYAGTKLTSRVVHAAVARKSPKWAKHASVLSSIGSATGAMLLAHRFERTKEYAAPIIVGASIAALQSVVQAYLPKYGWMVSDHGLNEQTQTRATRPTQISAGSGAASYSAGTALPPPIETLSVEEISDELEDLDMGVLNPSFGSDLSDAEMDAMIDETYRN